MAEADYRDWIGNTESAEDVAGLAPVKGLLATLDDVETRLGPGDALPHLWHWLYFLPQAPMREVGADGHPRRGGFMPPVALPRRMFAGAQLSFLAPIPLGATLRRESEIAGVEAKSGRSGELVFVTVRHRVFAGGTLAVEETQNIVYRQAGGPVPAPEAKPFAPAPAGAWVREVTPDPVLLFRYSALTFNGHRIHYDRPYATGEESYPGLVVHGPLLATLLMDLVRRNARRPVAGFSFRAMAPIFDTAPFRLLGQPEGDTVTIAAERADGATAMQATATLA
jgi:3-methylfumaryl-CoA hydratase